ncbi:hypothetical protein P7C73_g1201, partial [Tremellales sp. Uapishka_1]
MASRASAKWSRAVRRPSLDLEEQVEKAARKPSVRRFQDLNHSLRARHQQDLSSRPQDQVDAPHTSPRFFSPTQLSPARYRKPVVGVPLSYAKDAPPSPSFPRPQQYTAPTKRMLVSPDSHFYDDDDKKHTAPPQRRQSTRNATELSPPNPSEFLEDHVSHPDRETSDLDLSSIHDEQYSSLEIRGGESESRVIVPASVGLSINPIPTRVYKAVPPPKKPIHSREEEATPSNLSQYRREDMVLDSADEEKYSPKEGQRFCIPDFYRSESRDTGGRIPPPMSAPVQRNIHIPAQPGATPAFPRQAIPFPREFARRVVPPPIAQDFRPPMREFTPPVPTPSRIDKAKPSMPLSKLFVPTGVSASGRVRANAWTLGLGIRGEKGDVVYPGEIKEMRIGPREEKIKETVEPKGRKRSIQVETVDRPVLKLRKSAAAQKRIDEYMQNRVIQCRPPPKKAIRPRLKEHKDLFSTSGHKPLRTVPYSMRRERQFLRNDELLKASLRAEGYGSASRRTPLVVKPQMIRSHLATRMTQQHGLPKTKPPQPVKSVSIPIQRKKIPRLAFTKKAVRTPRPKKNVVHSPSPSPVSSLEEPIHGGDLGVKAQNQNVPNQRSIVGVGNLSYIVRQQDHQEQRDPSSKQQERRRYQNQDNGRPPQDNRMVDSWLEDFANDQEDESGPALLEQLTTALEKTQEPTDLARTEEKSTTSHREHTEPTTEDIASPGDVEQDDGGRVAAKLLSGMAMTEHCFGKLASVRAVIGSSEASRRSAPPGPRENRMKERQKRLGEAKKRKAEPSLVQQKLDLLGGDGANKRRKVSTAMSMPLRPKGLTVRETSVERAPRIGLTASQMKSKIPMDPLGEKVTSTATVSTKIGPSPSRLHAAAPPERKKNGLATPYTLSKPKTPVSQDVLVEPKERKAWPTTRARDVVADIQDDGDGFEVQETATDIADLSSPPQTPKVPSRPFSSQRARSQYKLPSPSQASQSNLPLRPVGSQAPFSGPVSGKRKASLGVRPRNSPSPSLSKGFKDPRK